MRRAKRVLSSFDLMLVGAWETDPAQRRALLSILRGSEAVAAMADAQVGFDFFGVFFCHINAVYACEFQVLLMLSPFTLLVTSF